LQLPINALFDEQISIIGNFPYNISTQIIFKVLEHKEQIPMLVGMFQKEVAERIASTPKGKTRGIMSVLTQAFYTVEYLFTVNENVFTPPPKVKSGVIRLTRKENFSIDCNEKEFYSIVKLAFNQRRKTLRNALKSLTLPPEITEQFIFNKRAEELSMEDFVKLTKQIGEVKKE
jgi:16S rRNA (adenine1518-N6/adenine1519-N6)-dimethyltransferase